MKPSDDTAAPSIVVPENAGASCREPAGSAAVIGPLVPAVTPPDDPHPPMKTNADTATAAIMAHRAARRRAELENHFIHAPPRGFVSL